MMKEIHEQPKAMKDTLNSVVSEGKINLSNMGITEEDITSIHQIYFVACGSAYHAGVVTQYVVEDMAQIPVRVEFASEFRYRKLLLKENDLIIIISQSGETADSLAALRIAKEMGVKTLAIVNVVGNSTAREADYVFYTMASPEIAVATTKAHSAQLIACYLLTIQFAKTQQQISDEQYAECFAEVKLLPEKIEKMLEDKERIQWFASKFANARDIFSW